MKSFYSLSVAQQLTGHLREKILRDGGASGWKLIDDWFWVRKMGVRKMALKSIRSTYSRQVNFVAAEVDSMNDEQRG